MHQVILKDKPLLEECTVRSVVLVDGTYFLFEEQAHYPLIWTIHKRISDNGLDWSLRSVSLFKRSDFDKLGQADPSVIYDNGFKMWFDALKSEKPDIWESIGYAVSPDGDEWVKIGAVLSISEEGFDSAFIHHPCVVKHEGTYYMFYAGSDRTDYRNMKVGLAISSDGISWEKHKDPVLENEGKFESINVRPSAPILINGLWYMWYYGFNGISRSIMLATSLDLIKWTKKGKVIGNPYGKRSEIDPTASSVMFVPPNTVRMWYAGYTGNSDFVTHSSLNYANIIL